jgi:hypothetical protein
LQIIKWNSLPTATTFAGAALSGRFNQDLAHGAAGDRKKMGSVRISSRTILIQAYKNFMHERRGL